MTDSSSTREQNDRATADKLTLLFGGDLCLGLRLHETIEQRGVDYPYERVKSVLQGADLTIVNLECYVSDLPPADPRAARMAISTQHAKGLQTAGIDVLCLANNHVMDAGEDGLVSTLAALQRFGIEHYGGGLNLADALALKVVEQKGVTVGILGACDFSPHQAGQDNAGVAPLDEKRLLERVAEARGEVDLLVVTLHGDVEFSDSPAPWRQQLSRRLVDAGAKLVIQHHPHVVQGVESYREGLIAYSLGNFVFSVANNDYQNKWPGTDEGMLLKVEIDRFGHSVISWKAIPLKIDASHCPFLPEPEEAERISRRIQRLNSDLQQGRGDVRQWKKRAFAEVRARFSDAYWACRKLQFGRACRELACLSRKEYLRMILGLVQSSR